jgi:carboxypeptidase Q
MEKGVPVICNIIKDTPDHKFYFTYHHSAGDSMLMMNADDMDSNVVGIASLLYILADLNVSLRTPKYTNEPNLAVLNGNV